MHEARCRTTRRNPRNLHTVRRVAPISDGHLVYLHQIEVSSAGSCVTVDSSNLQCKRRRRASAFLQPKMGHQPHVQSTYEFHFGEFRQDATEFRMTPAFSLYLDLLRLFAAGLVFVSHLDVEPVSGKMLWMIANHGTEGVVLFFVLSGFVIGHVAARREQTARDYAVARAAR